MKRFYNNTLTHISPMKRALRMVALLCVLLGFSSNAWGSYYFYQTSQDNWCSASGTWITPTQNGNIYTATATITEIGKNYYFWISTKKDDKCSIQSKDQVWITDEKPTSNISGVTCMRQNEWGCDPCSSGSYTNAHGFYIYSDVANIDILITADFTDVKNIKLSISKPVEPYVESDAVILTRTERYRPNDNAATLYGYYRNNPVQDGNACAIVVGYGFAYNEVATNKTPLTTSNAKYLTLGDAGASIDRGFDFSGTIKNLGADKIYAYRSFIIVNDTKYFSKETRYFTTKVCTNDISGKDIIEVYVDAVTTAESDSAYADDCELRYGNLQRALNAIKANSKIYKKIDDTHGNLLKPVIIYVSQFDSLGVDGKLGEKGTGIGTYYGVKRSVSGGNNGDAQDLYVNAIEYFNNKTEDKTSYNVNNTLTIKANNGDLPRIQHLLIRKSRNIILDGINMISDPTCKKLDTAFEIDNGAATGWHAISLANDGQKDANIIVQNCRVGSNGFTGVHISAYSGITFKNNTLNLKVQDFSTNALEYGASAKFLECSNIKFIQNNFWGGHATLLWLQETTNALFYNNVFWNTNEYDKNGCVAVRVYDQTYGDGKDTDQQRSNNISVLYNTFYLADDGKVIAAKKQYDFLKFGAVKENYGFGSNENIYFQYNNCYSYDEDMNGKGTDFILLNGFNNDNLCPNNFWSVYDQKQTPVPSFSGFDIQRGTCDKNFINVKDLVCESTATGPKDLVIRNPKDQQTASLKVGTKLTSQDISDKSGITLTDDELYSDRYTAYKRDQNGGNWTMGALEATDANTVNIIYWTGDKNSIWDLRSNWAYIPEDNNQNARLANQRTLTCVDILSPDLKIIIPEKGTAKYPTPTSGEFHYPQIPTEFDAGKRTTASKMLKPGSTTQYDDGVPASEQVSAGVGTGISPTKYAKSIELEYGAALKGVENLQNGESHYDMGITNMTMQREQWTLVGPIVWPFKSGESGETRGIVSADYYLNKMPNVLMRSATIEDEGDAFSANWEIPFRDMNRPVGEHEAYAVKLPNSYGNGDKRAEAYFRNDPDNADMVNDGTVPKSFKPMKGRFVNEAALPTYQFETTSAKLLNNSYPYNISAKALQGTNNANGTVYLYDYSANSFKPVDTEILEDPEKDAYIKPQHAFVFVPKTADDLTVETSMFADGDTKSRSTVVQTPALAINLYAGYKNSSNHSTIYVKQDPNSLEGIADSPLNAPKVFSLSDVNTPELYLLANDDRFARLCIGGKEQTIPLGIRLQKPMYVVFAKNYNKNFTKVMLLDTETGKEYNLLEKSHTVDILPAGETEGRFFLNVAVAADDYVEDDDVTTNVEDQSTYQAINMYKDADSSNGIRVITTNVELQHILVSDLMGRTLQYMASGNSAYIQLPDSKGIYIIQVVGDNATRTEKVILK
ncbi:MAG: T9SS type A sorting domain-containing protein [Paludibacteraceae bacterium]|nr:T9SS type A sorting domain-containing protein [Paludibacteraceae bacterium]